MKDCIRCHRTLDLSQFYIHNQMADGHLTVCVDCVRKRAKEYYERKMKEDPLFVQLERIRHREKAQRYRSDPLKRLKHETRMRTKLHVQQGRIKKSPCEVCGNERVEAHHDDYNNPMQVRWLCRRCHTSLHVERGDFRKQT